MGIALSIFLEKHKIRTYSRSYLVRTRIFLKFYPVRIYLNRQREMLHFWWRKPKGFDMTPKTPSRKIFGSHIQIENGAFRPTLFDVVSGKAKKRYYLNGR